MQTATPSRSRSRKAPPPNRGPKRTTAPDQKVVPAAQPPVLPLPGGRVLLAGLGVLLLGLWLALWAPTYGFTRIPDYSLGLIELWPPVGEVLRPVLQFFDAAWPGPPSWVPSPELLALLALLLTGIALAYLAALGLLQRGAARAPGAVWLVLAFALAFQATAFLMPGILTTDIASYLMYGQIGGLLERNPYVAVPADFPGHPLVEWIHPLWHWQPSVYGPLWTSLSVAVAPYLAPESLTVQTLAYKGLMNVVHLGNLALMWWLLGRLRVGDGSHAARVTAFAAFAWNPLLVLETAAGAHNDALMVLLLLASIAPLVPHSGSGTPLVHHSQSTRRQPATPRIPSRDVGDHRAHSARWLSAVGLLTASALVKFTSGLVGLFYAVAWLRSLPTWRARLAWSAIAASVGLAVTALFAWPWLDSTEALAPLTAAAEGRLAINSLPDVLALNLASWLQSSAGYDESAAVETARAWVRTTLRLLFVAYLAWEVRRVWLAAALDHASAVRALLASSVRTFLMLLLLVMSWVLAWYFTWPLALAVLLGGHSALARVAIGYTLTAFVVFNLHDYWWAATGHQMPDALLLLYALPPLLAAIPSLKRHLASPPPAH